MTSVAETTPPASTRRIAGHDAAPSGSGDHGFDPSRRFGSGWDEGMRDFASGAYWECHEALEPAWLASDGLDKHFLGGVILLAAALHKARAMGSARGGRRNYAKALVHLAHVPDVYGGVRVRELEARVHRALGDASVRPKVPGVPEGPR